MFIINHFLLAFLNLTKPNEKSVQENAYLLAYKELRRLKTTQRITLMMLEMNNLDNIKRVKSLHYLCYR